MTKDKTTEEAYELLEELVDLIDDYNEGKYKIDSFTIQPAKTFLAKIGRFEIKKERVKIFIPGLLGDSKFPVGEKYRKMTEEESKVERATDKNFLDFLHQMQEQRKGEKAVFMCVRCKKIKRLNVNYDELSLGFLPKGWFWFFGAVFCDECYKPFVEFMKETCGNE